MVRVFCSLGISKTCFKDSSNWCSHTFWQRIFHIIIGRRRVGYNFSYKIEKLTYPKMYGQYFYKGNWLQSDLKVLLKGIGGTKLVYPLTMDMFFIRRKNLS